MSKSRLSSYDYWRQYFFSILVSRASITKLPVGLFLKALYLHLSQDSQGNAQGIGAHKLRIEPYLGLIVCLVGDLTELLTE